MSLHHPEELKDLKRKLAQMVVSVYASRKRIPNTYEVMDAFKLREINLPEKIYCFLFSDKTNKFWLNPRKWLTRLTGQEAAEINRNLEEFFVFLEKFMGINNEQESNRKNYD
jgi:hypothetical protein